MTVEDAIADRIHRLIGRALIEFAWQRPKDAAAVLDEAAYHLRGLAGRAAAEQPRRECAYCRRAYRGDAHAEAHQ